MKPRNLRRTEATETNEQRERPIIFSGPMVRAILEDRKTQTRRVIKPQPTHFHDFGNGRLPCKSDMTKTPSCADEIPCPYGQPRDRLWVRETWKPHIQTSIHSTAIYKADYALSGGPGPWKPSIFMPRWASRLTLEIAGIRVERVQEITEKDAVAEGIIVQPGHLWWPLGSKEPMKQYTHRQAFSALWDSINAKRGFGWDKNPWVWVIEFRKR